MVAPQSFTLTFLHKEQLAKNTYSFYFDRSNVDFNFLPGQYIRMTLPHKNPDNRGTSRYFTVASSPLQKDILQITAKVVQSSFKETLLTLRSGQRINFFGPMGNFYLREDRNPHVFLSGGIGVTPFHSMLLYAAEKKIDIALTLIAVFSGHDELIFYEKLSTLAKENSNIRVIYTVTSGDSSREWLGATGRVSKELLDTYVKDIKNSFYYVVGPASMVEDTRNLLVNLSIDSEQIITEDFTGY